MLERVRQALGDDEERGALHRDWQRSELLGCRDELRRDRHAVDQLLGCRLQPALDQQRRHHTVDQVAELVDGDLQPGAQGLRFGVLLTVGKSVGQAPRPDPEQDHPALQSIVEVAGDPSPFDVGRFDDA